MVFIGNYKYGVHGKHIASMCCSERLKSHFSDSQKLKSDSPQRTQRAQSFILLTAPSALLTKKGFLCALCVLCGEKFLTLFFYKLALTTEIAHLSTDRFA